MNYVSYPDDTEEFEWSFKFSVNHDVADTANQIKEELLSASEIFSENTKITRSTYPESKLIGLKFEIGEYCDGVIKPNEITITVDTLGRFEEVFEEIHGYTENSDISVPSQTEFSIEAVYIEPISGTVFKDEDKCTEKSGIGGCLSSINEHEIEYVTTGDYMILWFDPWIDKEDVERTLEEFFDQDRIIVSDTDSEMLDSNSIIELQYQSVLSENPNEIVTRLVPLDELNEEEEILCSGGDIRVDSRGFVYEQLDCDDPNRTVVGIQPEWRYVQSG